MGAETQPPPSLTSVAEKPEGKGSAGVQDGGLGTGQG